MEPKKEIINKKAIEAYIYIYDNVFSKKINYEEMYYLK